ncbi:MAG: T9SS type A sorting domain-containing protein [Kaistella sp.]
MYPNPSVAEINVKTTNGELIKKIQIIDVSGKVVLTSLTEKNIDISKLNQSVYFVKIYTDSEIYTSKLIKK